VSAVHAAFPVFCTVSGGADVLLARNDVTTMSRDVIRDLTARLVTSPVSRDVIIVSQCTVSD